MSMPSVALAQTVEIRQLDYWVFDEATQTEFLEQADSRVFQIELSFDPNDPAAATLLDENDGAYVNILFRPDAAFPWEWGVQNVFLSVPDATWLEPGNCVFEFGSSFWTNGIPLDACEIDVVLEEEPAPEEPIVFEGEFVPVHSRDRYQPGGGEPIDETEEPIGLEPPLDWENMDYTLGQVRRGREAGNTLIPPSRIPAVSELTDGCTEGAHTRSLGYLSTYWDFELSYTDWNGQEHSGLSDLYGEYSFEMIINPSMSNEEKRRRLLLMREYREFVHVIWGLKIRSGETARNNFTPNSLNQALRDAIKRLQHGHDVEISYSKKKKDGSWSSHRTMLYRIETIPRKDKFYDYKISMMDDDQGDGVAGRRVRSFILGFDGVARQLDADGNEVHVAKINQIFWDEYIPRLFDLNNDGVVNGGDLGLLLAKFGSTPDGGEDDGDFNGDGVVDGADLGILLANWFW